MSLSKRFHILRTGSDETSRTVREFKTRKEAETWMLDICSDYEPGDKIGWWFLESQAAPVMLEIVDWSSQLEPAAVC